MIFLKSRHVHSFLIWNLLIVFLHASGLDLNYNKFQSDAPNASFVRTNLLTPYFPFYNINKGLDDPVQAFPQHSKVITIAANNYSEISSNFPDYPATHPSVSRQEPASCFQEVEKMLGLPESEVKVGLGNLLIGKIYSPDIDINKYLNELDRISSHIKARIGRSKAPRKIIKIINTYLFDHYGLVALDGPYTKDFLIHELLDTKKGACMSLVALYLAIAERIDFPLYSICLPEHIFIRWVSPKKRKFYFFKRNLSFNIETLKNGNSLPDKHYEGIAKKFKATNANEFYLRPLTKKETLATYLSPLGNSLRKKERFDEAIQACRLSISINAKDAEAWNSLGVAYRRKGNLDKAIFAYRRALEVYPNFAEAWHNLGTVQEGGDKRIEYFKKAISLKPELEEAWTNLVEAYMVNGKYELAWACVNQCNALGYNLPASWIRELHYKIQLGSQ